MSEIDPVRHISHFTVKIELEKHLMEKLIKQIERVIEVTHAEYKEGD